MSKGQDQLCSPKYVYITAIKFTVDTQLGYIVSGSVLVDLTVHQMKANKQVKYQVGFFPFT